mgnify:CR=1 FL=1
MQFQRITNVQDPLFAPAWVLYEESFPLDERRSRIAQQALMTDEAYYFYAICENGSFAGIFLLWKTEDFVYLEHFAVLPELRCRGVGARAVRQLLSRYPAVILEVDPPSDPISLRRQRFYERLGLVQNPYHHVQPPYQAGCRAKRLLILSRPALAPDAFSRFSSFFHSHVAVYTDL